MRNEKVSRAELIELIKEGHSDVDIAKMLGMAASNIRKRCAPLRKDLVEHRISKSSYIHPPYLFKESKGIVYFRGDFTAKEILTEAEANRA